MTTKGKTVGETPAQQRSDNELLPKTYKETLKINNMLKKRVKSLKRHHTKQNT